MAYTINMSNNIKTEESTNKTNITYKPILMNMETEVKFIFKFDTTITSPNKLEEECMTPNHSVISSPIRSPNPNPKIAGTKS